MASALAAAGGLALMGCSTGSSSTPTSSGSATTSAADAAGSTTVDVPPYDAAHNARPDVATGACTGNATTGWTLHGTVRNSTTTAHHYSIAVDFITMPGDTVQGTSVVNVGPVAPHATAKWSTPATAKGKSDLHCVVRQALFS